MKLKNQFLKEVSFPLGGIGTGCIGLGGDGRLIDWEIFNRPSKGSFNGYSHFAVRAIQDEKITAAVLHGDLQKDYIGRYTTKAYQGYGHGPSLHTMCGFPHFKTVEFNGEFPVAEVTFSDDNFPAEVKLVAFNPFIPLDSENSSIPAAFFEIEFTNTTDKPVIYQGAFSVENPFKKGKNTAEKNGELYTITMCDPEMDKESLDYGDLTIAADCPDTYFQSYWLRGRGSQESAISFWKEFSGDKEIKNRVYDTAKESGHDTCSLVSEVEVLPGEKKKMRFILAWNMPNTNNYWSERDDENLRNPWKNYYATVFESSKHSATFAMSNWDDLYKKTDKFRKTLYGATLPEQVINAAASNLAVLKSPTVLRLEDGTFYGWEGVNGHVGSCQGTCQHVWNYAYALCFLFPDLERSIRDLEFKYNTAEDGKMGFRIQLPLGSDMEDFRACVDGQMGTLIKCYRDWKITGNSDWLRENWTTLKNVLEYAWSPANPDCWDLDKDGVLEGRQHHTLDLELFGPSSWLEGMYLAALKAAAEMADFLEDYEKAEEYRALFEKGYNFTKENLFNGKYFIHKLDVCDKSMIDRYEDVDYYWHEEGKQIKYQICEGSSIDQVLAQWHADIIGLGEIYDKEQLSSALNEMLKNNFKPSMRNFFNPCRVYCVNDEAGTVICDYPEGAEMPLMPILYCQETMTGFEYSFAGLLCSQGRFEDGLKVVKAVRDRFDGEKRNPWNEFECGSNYARSMASFALLPILSGFEFDMPHKHIGFKPYVGGDFKCIWSLECGWGCFEIKGNVARVNVYDGCLGIKSLGLGFADKVSGVKIDGKDIDFRFEDGKLYFDDAKISNCIEISL